MREKLSAPRSTFVILSLAIVVILLELAASLHNLKGGWDDAAITAAFSRTYFDTGRIALTPGSPVVEGFSSLLWFFMLAPAGLLHTPAAFLCWMKILAAVFALGSTGLVYLIVKDLVREHLPAAIAALMFALLLPTWGEIWDGMEMNSAAFFLLLLFLILYRNSAHTLLKASVAGSCLLLTRFEAPFFIGLLLLGFVIAAVRYGREPRLSQLLWLSGLLAGVFVAISLWRHYTFGLWMPNTIFAKRFLPYRDWRTLRSFTGTRYRAMFEVLSVLGLPLLVALIVFLWAASKGRHSLSKLHAIHPAIWTLSSACFLWGLVAGSNWGYPGRMFAGALPFLLICVVAVCALTLSDKVVLRRVLILLLIVHLAPLRRLRKPLMRPSVAMIEPGGVGADIIRQALQQDRLRLMIPDVGGSALCCERLDFIDSGLLANPTLAKKGWQALPAYFKATHPDVVETHGSFQRIAGVYRDHLLDGYSIVGADGKRFFVRDDLFQQLLDRREGKLVPVQTAPACMPHATEDVAVSEMRRSCLLLDKSPIQNNFP